MQVAIVDDIAMLQGLGVKIVLVLGAAPQIDHILRMRQQKPRFIAGYRLTDELAMEAAMEAAGTARTLLEALLSKVRLLFARTVSAVCAHCICYLRTPRLYLEVLGCGYVFLGVDL